MGQIGAAFTNPNTFAKDPSGFNGSEWAARGIGDTARGLGQGLQNYAQQNQAMRNRGGMGGTGNFGSAAPGMPDFVPQMPKGNNINFYGGGS